ncbi:tetratricopeptide repeat protein [Exilibacterium tricleocarpae]|uniref:Tetratricopeptide repeat protein n=1 Tax=Exilibacterium tricleocarpae TaxID=2591008 RepID=A0A545SMR9_9GAMM|nr:serine/threonine-protein kinase [Exilibacterium tricleocarpae]TQV66300.1 tetratricopeptide repeat protein [Exilibacterium tricleocarpae]
MTLSKERWKTIESVLDRVLDQPVENQTEYLRSLCAGDEDLFSEVKALLDAEQNAPDYIEQPAADFAQPLLQEYLDYTHPPAAQPNFDDMHIGPYHLCEEIGRGGMGVVYRAERRQGEFEQQVAIKLLWSGHKSDMALDRFKQEQQLLASLTHPSIAQLYDGGLTEEGHPYFVMEYVAGEPLDRYCDRRELDVDDTLRLLLRVADVISFAHKHLIVHRDIKSSNIFVTEQGHIKLLDFGIAKLLDTQQDTNLTRTGEQLLTPGCAAPEQLQNGNITIATDIYQLGLVTYYLLSGRQPYQDRAKSLAELIRMICEEEPSPPSVAITSPDIYTSKTGDKPARQLCFAEPKKRRKKLEGDLDAIVLKMLKHLPDERYPSVEALRADIIAYFDNRPVTAQKQSLAYQSKKYLRRHWRPVSVVSVFFALLGTYATTMTYQANEIRMALEKSQIEQNKSQRVSDFLVNIFKAADPNVAGLETITAKALLDQGQDRIVTELNNIPEVQAYMLTLIGEIYFSQGNLADSTRLLEEALQRRRELEGPESLGLATTLTQLAFSYQYAGRGTEAKALLEESLSIYHHSRETESVEYAETLSLYGYLFYEQGNYESAIKHLQRAIAILEPIDNGQHEELASALNDLAVIQHFRGDFTAARENMRRAIGIHRAVLGEEHSYYSLYVRNFATMLTDMEVFDEAQALAEQALKMQEKILDKRHLYITYSLKTLGVLAYRRGELADAERYLRNTVDLQAESAQPAPLVQADNHLWLGAVLQDGGHHLEADRHYTKMIELFRQHTESGEIIGRALCQIASLALAQGQLQKARTVYEEALRIMPAGNIRFTLAQVGYAQVLLELNDHNAAEQLLRSALELRSARYPSQHSMIAETQVLLGLATSIKGDKSEAERHLTQGLAVLNQNPLFNYGTRKQLLTLGRTTLSTLAR